MGSQPWRNKNSPDGLQQSGGGRRAESPPAHPWHFPASCSAPGKATGVSFLPPSESLPEAPGGRLREAGVSPPAPSTLAVHLSVMCFWDMQKLALVLNRRGSVLDPAMCRGRAVKGSRLTYGFGTPRADLFSRGGRKNEDFLRQWHMTGRSLRVSMALHGSSRRSASSSSDPWSLLPPPPQGPYSQSLLCFLPGPSPRFLAHAFACVCGDIGQPDPPFCAGA